MQYVNIDLAYSALNGGCGRNGSS